MDRCKDGWIDGWMDEAATDVTANSLWHSSRANQPHQEHCGWTEKHFSPVWRPFVKAQHILK